MPFHMTIFYLQCFPNNFPFVRYFVFIYIGPPLRSRENNTKDIYLNILSTPQRVRKANVWVFYKCIEHNKERFIHIATKFEDSIYLELHPIL